MSIRFVLVTAQKDLRRLGRDLRALAIWMGIPLLIGTLFSLAFGNGAGVRPKPHLLIVDQDQSFVSQALVGFLGSGGPEGFALVDKVSFEEGNRRIAEGDGSALLILPKGLGLAVLEGSPATLHLTTNPAQRILPAMIQESLEILCEMVFYLRRLAGDTLSKVAGWMSGEGGMADDAAVAALAVEVKRFTEGLKPYLDPPMMSVQTEVETVENPLAKGAGYLMAPGILFMSLLFMAQGLAADLWTEREEGTLWRFLTTPRRVGNLVLGKTLAGFVLMAGVSVVALLLGAAAFEIEVARLPLAALWASFSGAVLLLLFQALFLFASSRKGASLLGTAVVFPLLMLGGSFFPFEAMPDWMVAAGRWTPNGLAVSELKAILDGRWEMMGLGSSFLILSGVATVAVMVGSWRMRRGFLST